MSGRGILSPLERLRREPARFSLDQASAVLAPDGDATAISYRSQPRLGAPAGEVAQARPETRELVTPTFGLVGPGGTLPRHFTATVGAELRRRSTALHDLLDLLSRRFVALFVRAGAKYRPTRNPKAAETVLAGAIGLGTRGLAERLATPLPALLYHAGALAARSGSAERLRGMLSEETGGSVRIIEFAGGWIRLPPTEQTRLSGRLGAGAQARLGQDAVVGAQIWDASARFLVQLGPLSRRDFEALLPGAPLHQRLVELIRQQVGLECDFALNPVLAAAEVPPLQLSREGGARLGWSGWLGAPRPRRADAADALLGPQAGPARRPPQDMTRPA